MTTMDKYIEKDGKKLRYGYTTGSCATMAAKAGLYTLIGRGRQDMVRIMTPKGWPLEVEVHYKKITEETVKCYVTKDAGDDPDVTHGLQVFAKVSYRYDGLINIFGGEGIGTVTKKGLSVPVGQSAINPTPLNMIKEEVKALKQKNQGFDIEISAPAGVELAKKTFNPMLGIEGGISIIGTSGIVEPMSEDALIDTLKVELSIKKAEGHKQLLVVFGNYGRDFMLPRIAPGVAVQKISNFVEKSFEFIGDYGFEQVLFVGHMGKMVKASLGIGNTHSKYGDRRMEAIINCSRNLKTDEALVKQITESNTTDEAASYLTDAGICEAVMDQCATDVKAYVEDISGDHVQIETMVFSNVYGLMGRSKEANKLLEELKNG